MANDAPTATDRAFAPFRVGFVPGVTPDKWSRIWEQRLRHLPLELTPIEHDAQVSVLREHRADMCFVRSPVERDQLNLIPLYREVPVVVVPKDHPLAAYDEITVDDLVDQHVLDSVGSPQQNVRKAIETVAEGTSVVVVPMSLARLHHRRDVTYRPVIGASESEVGLAWLADSTDPRVEQFIGIVRGRTERSSRDAGAGAKASTTKAVLPPRSPKRGRQPRQQARQQPKRGTSKRGSRRADGR